MMAEDSDGFIHRRLTAVPGYSDRVNDIFVLGNIKASNQHVIFFGGDVQDYPEVMESHRDNKRYVEWNTEAAAKKIADRFPNSIIFVIKPAYMHIMTLATYSNFWIPSETRNPIHCENGNAIQHLYQLYNSVVEKIYTKASVNISNSIPIQIIGFSKGCTVLNQFLYELHLLREIESLNNFFKQIKAFYWLDGGHSGGPGDTWITQDAPLQDLASLGCEIHIHVSPYQIKDALRVWVGKEEAKFYKKLKKFKVTVHRTVHFESEPSSIENHFCILNEF